MTLCSKHDFPEFWTFCETTLVFFSKIFKIQIKSFKMLLESSESVASSWRNKNPQISQDFPGISSKSPDLRFRILRFSIQKWSEFFKTSITCNFLSFYRISIIFGVLKPDNFSLQKRIRF